MITFDAVDGRRVTVRSRARMPAQAGLAKVVPARSGGLSSETIGVAYGPSDAVGQFIAESRLRRLGSESIAGGEVRLYAVPTGEIARTHLPAETRIGVLDLGAVTAHGYFYRPFNRMADVVEYFRTLDLRPAMGGLAVPTDRFRIIDQSYTTSVEGLGLVVLEPPRGVPAAGAASAPAGGRMWIDRVPNRMARVVFENRAARLSFLAPGWRKAASTDLTPEFEHDVLQVTGGLSAVTWN